MTGKSNSSELAGQQIDARALRESELSSYLVSLFKQRDLEAIDTEVIIGAFRLDAIAKDSSIYRYNRIKFSGTQTS